MTDLKDEDAQLWKKITHTIEPLSKRKKSKKNIKPLTDQMLYIGDKKLPEKKTAKKAAITQTVKTKIHTIQTPAYRENQRGRKKIFPDAKVDLHYYTIETAREKLLQTLIKAQRENISILCVITGKGYNYTSFRNEGRLRNALPNWLTQPDFSPLVREWSPARKEHGGEGAFYLFIRKRKI